VQTFEEFVEQSQRATTVLELERLFAKAMADEGFDNYAMGAVVDGAIVDMAWVEFPAGHFENYIAEGWSRIDPILAFTARAMRPFSWDAVAADMQFSAPQTALLEECERVGVRWLQILPFQGHNGRCDFVGVSRRHAEPPDPARIPLVRAVSAQAFCRHADLIGSDLTNDAAMNDLTRRELEVLKWMKHGKSNTEIADIVSVSVKTVEYHVGNILKKLGASNRTAAVVTAIKNRLLAL
jgi:DNA-binding CsgD family transcriptional regulator